jgi:hypothetical protein
MPITQFIREFEEDDSIERINTPEALSDEEEFNEDFDLDEVHITQYLANRWKNIICN